MGTLLLALLLAIATPPAQAVQPAAAELEALLNAFQGRLTEEPGLASGEACQMQDPKKESQKDPEDEVTTFKDCINLMDPYRGYSAYEQDAKDHLKYWQKLPKEMDLEEYIAILSYTRGGYSKLNRSLREGGLAAERSRLCMERLNSALDSVPPFSDQLVYRGATLPPQMLDAHAPGEVVKYPAFTSTSSQRPFSMSHQFVILSKSGRDISRYSSTKEEAEVLFKAPTCFKVLDRLKPQEVDRLPKTDPWDELDPRRLGKNWTALVIMEEAPCDSATGEKKTN
jgi:hypothetical protein